MQCFRKIPVAKNFIDMSWGGGNKVYRRKMFVLKCRKISYLNPSLLCFRKFPVAKKFMDKRGGKDGGSITIFRRKFFVSQFRKILLVNFSDLCFRNFL